MGGSLPRAVRLFGTLDIDSIVQCETDRDPIPSLRPGGALDRVAALRRRHCSLGHTPDEDRTRTPLFFFQGIENFLLEARRTGDVDRRCNRLIAAAALTLALHDREAAIAAEPAPCDAPPIGDLFDA